ncbi:hypothetical protein V5O48_003437 [Marasmius crinis-equi]|uniref:Uncharacterized protein n=1 Tax=Marasmius crinis-equi TaxID=585013 RepID=A0ABR3FSX7_9AGAR
MTQSVWPNVCSWTAKLLDYISNDRVLEDVVYQRIPRNFMDRVLAMAINLLTWGCKQIQTLHPQVSSDIQTIFLDKAVPSFLGAALNYAYNNQPMFPAIWVPLYMTYSKHLFNAWLEMEFPSDLVILCSRRLRDFPPPPSRSQALTDEHVANNLLVTFVAIHPDTWLDDDHLDYMLHRDSNVVGWAADKMAREAQGELDSPFEPKFYHFLCEIFVQGFSWASQALEGDIIKSITKIPGKVAKQFSARGHDTEGRNVVEETSQQLVALVQTLKSLLVYRSVLHRVLRVMTSTRESNTYKRLKDIDEPVATALDSLFTAASSLKGAMDLFDLETSKWDCCTNKFVNLPLSELAKTSTDIALS